MSFWLNHRNASRTGTALLMSVLGLASAVSAQETFNACYVPEVGVLYMIGIDGLPEACLSESHVEFSWTEGGRASDAELLDGLDSQQFLRSDASGTIAGSLTVTGNVDGQNLQAAEGVVAGALRLQDGSEDAGRVLTSDDLGHGEWQRVAPTFITRVAVASGKGAVGPSVFDAASYVPEGTTAVLLEAEAAIGGPDSGDVDAHIRVRADAASPSFYTLLRGRAASTENVAVSNQGTFPISSDRTFEFVVEPPGFNNGWVIHLIGYW